MNTTSTNEHWNHCVRFHGHECPGLAIGFRAAMAGLDFCHGFRAPDEEVVAVVENDACGVDAIQALIGCTFGKGNLIHLDYGKQAFNFFERSSGRSLRLSLRPGAVSLGDRQRELTQKDREGKATREDRQELAKLRQESMLEILNRPLEEIFSQSESPLSLPQKAIVQPSEICPDCGEPTMPLKMLERSGKKLCRSCADSNS